MTNLDLSQDYKVTLDLTLRAGGVWRFIRRAVFSPLSLIRLPIAFIIGMQVLPAAYKTNFMHRLRSLFHDDLLDFREEPISSDLVKISKVTSLKIFGEETSYGFYRKNPKTNSPLQHRKVLVLILGNGYSTKQYLQTIETISKTQDFSLDIYGIDHAICDGFFTFDKEKTIRNSCAHLIRLMKAGYKPENMIIHGMSLGGAISAATLHRFKEYKLTDGSNIKFGAIIAEKTFSSVADYIAGSNKIAAKKHEGVSNFLRHLINFAKWDFNTLAIWDKLPVANRFAFNMDNDHVIPKVAALANKVAGGLNLSWGETEIYINDQKLTLNPRHASSLDQPSYLLFIEMLLG